jgi:hypothetical protein
MNASEYRIVEVDDLPEDLEWLLIDEPDAVTFVVRRGCWSARLAAGGWAAYRKVMHQREKPSQPEQRRWLYAV